MEEETKLKIFEFIATYGWAILVIIIIIIALIYFGVFK